MHVMTGNFQLETKWNVLFYLVHGYISQIKGKHNSTPCIVY